MEKLFLTKKQIKNVIRKKKRIEEELGVKLEFSKGAISINGMPLDEYTATQVINALAFGFKPKVALLLQSEDYMFEVLQIKNYMRSHSNTRLREVKARIIGKKGKAIRTLSQLSECEIKLVDNSIAIIGRTEDVKKAEQAIISLIKGSKHGNIYARLERLRHVANEEDLGLK